MGKPKKREPEKRAPNEREAAAIVKARAEREARPARVQVAADLDKPGVLKIEPEHSDEQGHSTMVVEAFATTSDDFATLGLAHLANTTNPGGGQATSQELNSGLALMGAIAPRDELEAALAMQMVATHELAMLMLTRSRSAGYVEQVREYGNLATKLSRTFTGQMKQLADHRRGGEQVVRHVHVYEGGQAMVAETIQIGGSNANPAQPPHALGTAMLGHDAAGYGVPITRDPGQEAMPHARREEHGRTRKPQ